MPSMPTPAMPRPKRRSAPRSWSSATRTRSPRSTWTGPGTSSARALPRVERLLRLLVPIVVPIAGIAVTAVGWVSGKPVGQAIVSGLGVALMVAVQLVFWFTLVFAIAERTGAGRADAGSRGRPTSCRSCRRRTGWASSRRSPAIAFYVFMVVAHRLGAGRDADPDRRDRLPAVRPRDLEPGGCGILAVIVAEIVFAIALYLRGRLDVAVRVRERVLNVAFTVPAVYLLQNDLLLDPGLVAAIDAAAGGDWLQPDRGDRPRRSWWSRSLDAADGFRKAGAPRARSAGHPSPPDDRRQGLTARPRRPERGVSPSGTATRRGRRARPPTRRGARPGSRRRGLPRPIASTSTRAAGGRTAATAATARRKAVERHHDPAEREHEDEQQVREGERRLGAERAGHQQPEPGERDGARRRAPRRPRAGFAPGPGAQPSSPAATPTSSTTWTASTSDDRRGLRGDEDRRPRGRPAEALEDAVGPLVAGRDRERRRGRWR